MSNGQTRSPLLRGGTLGAIIGAVLGFVAVLVVDRIVAGPQNDGLWLPVGTILGIVAGGTLGMLFAQVAIGGREDEAATKEAFDAIAADAARREQP